MALSFVNVTTTAALIGSTNITVNKPTGVVDGDMLLCCIGSTADSAVTPSAGWNPVASVTGSNSIHVYSKVASSEPASWTFTRTTTTAIIGVIAWNSSTATAIVVDANATDSSGTGSTSRVCPGVTTTRSNAAVHWFFIANPNDTYSEDGSTTERWDANSSNCDNYLMTQVVAATGATGTRTATGVLKTVNTKYVTVAIAEDVSSGPDGAPSGLTATAFDDDRIDLEWTDGSTNEDGFSIERSPNGTDTWAEIDTVAANETTYSDTGLTEYTNYWYRVRAFTTGPTYSDYSNTATDQTLLAAPSGLTATANGDVQIDLEWTINSAVPPDGTAIERSPNGSTGWTEIATVAHPTNTYGNSGLNPETTYYYRVRSYKVEA